MKLSKFDIFSFVLILIISLFFVSELFLFNGLPAGFDSKTHITTLMQFGQALKSGDFPVVWLNNFGNYGLPVGITAHQLTNYFGAFITFFTLDPKLSYDILILISTIFTNILFYIFLRQYFKPLACFLGVLIFCFTPYRIFTVYIRGALPEYFSSIFLPLILLSLYIFILKKKFYGLILLTVFTAGLTLCHPMMLVVYSFLFLAYLVFLVLTSGIPKVKKLKIFLASLFGTFLGVLICSYYVLPLNLETKYLYYSQQIDHLVMGNFLSFANYFVNRWDYFRITEVFARGHIVQFGLLETFILIFGLTFYIYEKKIKKSKENFQLLGFVLVTSLLLIFFTTQLSEIFYKHVFFLNSLQFPWRFLSALTFLPPIVAASLYNRFPKRRILICVVIAVCLFSFPQIYGKNLTAYPISSYNFSKENLYSVTMNTIWSGRSEDYPTRKIQAEVIGGNGKIINQNLSNSSRKYTVDAKTALRLVDYTFYFPGWNVYVDNVKTNIEFQDPIYRGIITYRVPTGKHSIRVVFEDTKIRAIAKDLSILFSFIFIALFITKNYIKKYIFG